MRYQAQSASAYYTGRKAGRGSGGGYFYGHQKPICWCMGYLSNNLRYVFWWDNVILFFFTATNIIASQKHNPLFMEGQKIEVYSKVTSNDNEPVH